MSTRRPKAIVALVPLERIGGLPVIDVSDAKPVIFDEAELHERAQAVYPKAPRLAAAWLRAVRYLRTTKRGWILDEKVKRNP